MIAQIDGMWSYIRSSLNFYRLHLLLLSVPLLALHLFTEHVDSMIVPLTMAAIFSASNGRFRIPFIDALFMCISAGTGTGLTTVDLSSTTGWQQAIIVVLEFIGNQVRCSTVTIDARRLT